METERLFIGVKLDNEYSDILLNSLDNIDSNQWGVTQKENLHLTLLFIGEVNKSIIPYIEEILENIAEKTRPFSLMGGRAIIMRPDEPTMLWAKFDRSKYFEQLVFNLEKYFKKIGTWEIHKQKAYNKIANTPVPHITLARIVGGGMLDSLLPPISLDRKSESFTARSLALYRVERKEKGSQNSYIVLNEWQFGLK